MIEIWYFFGERRVSVGFTDFLPQQQWFLLQADGVDDFGAGAAIAATFFSGNSGFFCSNNGFFF